MEYRLHEACFYNDIDKVIEYLKDGDDPNHYDLEQWTPIHYAIRNMNEELIHVLISYHANLNIKTKNNWSPLHIAISSNSLRIFELLVNNGADLTVLNEYNQSLLHIAVQKELIQMIKLIMKFGIDTSLKDIFGYTALDYAISIDNSEVQHLLTTK